jgi:two-component system chemotaxis sensor kinase CheA
VNVQRVFRVGRGALRRLGPRLVVPFGDELLPVLSLAGRLGAAEASRDADDDGATLTMLLLTSGDRRGAVRVDDVLEERDFVAQPIAHGGAGVAARYTGVVLRDADEALPLVAPAFLLAGGVGAAGTELAPAEGATRTIRARVLVVDDSITTRALEASVLESAGFEVTTAVDGVEALGMLERGGIDLVVTDIEMPRMDGIALCEAIRRTPRLARLPVVVVTSLDRPEQRARGLEAGADAYVTKSSFDQDDFLRVARQLVADRAPEGAREGEST